MAVSYRDLYTKLSRTITRFVDVFVAAELDCVATVQVEHEGETYVIMWDGLSRPQDFRVLERNGDDVAHAKAWRDPAHPYRMAAVAVGVRPLHKEARRVVEEQRKLLESAALVLHDAMATSPPASQDGLPAAPASGGSSESPESQAPDP